MSLRLQALGTGLEQKETVACRSPRTARTWGHLQGASLMLLPTLDVVAAAANSS